jgi:long-chain fatty acid transport protein
VADASAVFYNPAALVEIGGRQFLVSVSPVGVSTQFTDSGSGRPSLGPVAIPVPLGGSGGDAGGWIPVPNAYLSWKVASQVALGFGVNVPFGLKTEWEPDWVGRFHAVKSEVKTLNLNPTVAVKVTDWLSLGAGANYQRLDAELSQNVAYGGIAVGAASRFGPAAAAGIMAQLGGPAGLSREGLGQVQGDDWSWGFNVGARVLIGDSARLGASYRSKVKHEIQGTATFNDSPSFLTSGPLGALGTGLNARFADGPVSGVVELPDTASVAAAYQAGRVELLADWTWTGWQSLQELEIVRDDGSMLSEVPLLFEDTWRVGLGMNYALKDNWRLRLGTAYDKTPVQDAYRTPRLPDQDRIWAAAGVELKLGKGALDVGYAHLFVKDASSTLPNQELPTSAPAGELTGTYPANVDLVTVQYRISF